LAYLLPVLQQMNEENKKGVSTRPNRPRALILLPSRELAAQVNLLPHIFPLSLSSTWNERLLDSYLVNGG
jgi:hypothetical protein